MEDGLKSVLPDSLQIFNAISRTPTSAIIQGIPSSSSVVWRPASLASSLLLCAAALDLLRRTTRLWLLILGISAGESCSGVDSDCFHLFTAEKTHQSPSKTGYRPLPRYLWRKPKVFFISSARSWILPYMALCSRQEVIGQQVKNSPIYKHLGQFSNESQPDKGRLRLCTVALICMMTSHITQKEKKSFLSVWTSRFLLLCVT